MSEVKWIKLSTQMFEDEKIRLIEHMPEADTILIIWVKLLAQAGKTNASGFIYLNENIPYSDEMIATIFNRPIATVRLALNTFEQFGMIEILDNNFISISNWEKHQNIDGLTKIRENNRKRVQRYRERQKSLTGNVTSNGDETQGNALEEDKNKSKKEDKNNIYSNEFEQFWSIYPRKVDKKKALKSFKVAVKNHSLKTIIDGTRKYAKQVEKTDKQYIKHPTTFLNNDSFIDGFEEGGSRYGTNQDATAIKEQYGLDF